MTGIGLHSHHIPPLQAQLIHIPVKGLTGVFETDLHHLGDVRGIYLPEPVVGIQFGAGAEIAIHPLGILRSNLQLFLCTASSGLQAFHPAKIGIVRSKTKKLMQRREPSASGAGSL
jgi:hypothetical protein